MPKGSLLDAVVNAVQAHKRVGWWDSLPKDAQEELLEIRRTWQNGGYPVTKTAMARILSEQCQSRGFKTVKEKKFAEWLQKS
jgi:hypothetical protein